MSLRFADDGVEERCDRCGIALAPPDPRDPDDRGVRCSACVASRDRAERKPQQLGLEISWMSGRGAP